jgi:hypothetical protein
MAEITPEIRSLHSQPSWILRSSTVEMAVTRMGGQMAPVHFACDTAQPIQPYAISPWQDETEGLPESGSERILRGDFFCLPFGRGKGPRGEDHAQHGATASAAWSLIGATRQDGVHTLQLSMETPVRKGTVTRTLTLRDGENVVYSATRIDGFAGPATMGHHAVLALPDRDGSLLVSTAPLLFGTTTPYRFGRGEEGSYQSLAVNKTFRSLTRVPSIFRDTPPQDCSAFPARRGFTDLLQIAQRPTAGEPGWVAAVNTEERYLWFSLKNLAALPSTVLWIENCGRYVTPWRGRTCVLGLEDVCSYFDMGISAAMAPNGFSEWGASTVHRLTARRPFEVRYIQGVLRTPRGFSKVKRAYFPEGGVVFVDGEGREARTAVDSSFVFASGERWT